MTEPTAKLPGRSDELLQSFPASEPNFEAMATAITARISAGAPMSPDDSWLKAPDLAPEAGEPAVPSPARAATAPKSNFAEMARRTLQKKDDGAELAKELLAATAQIRRPNAELVERVRAAAGSPLTAAATPLPASKRDATSEASAEEARPSGVVARLEPPKPARLDRGTLIGIAGGIVAIAACMALFLQSSRDEDPTSAAVAAERAARPDVTEPKLPPPSAVPIERDDGVLSPESLAAAPEAAERAEPEPVKSAGKKGAGVVAAAPLVAGGAPAARSAAPAPVALEEDAAAPLAGHHAEKSALPPEPKLEPAEGASGNVPLSPSSGAVATALSSVRGDAQACLAGQSDAVSASVTFGADGRVLRVSAPGPAASCIQAALSKARIAPFARDSFTASTTIRPP